MDLQKLLNTMGEVSRNTRSDYHLTLGRAIALAERLEPDSFVKFSDGGAPGEEMSYRGYYSDLAFDRADRRTVAEFLAMCRRALNSTYQGYKGGDFVMDEKTPLWRAQYGDCGEAIVGHEVDDEGNLILHCKAAED